MTLVVVRKVAVIHTFLSRVQELVVSREPDHRIRLSSSTRVDHSRIPRSSSWPRRTRRNPHPRSPPFAKAIGLARLHPQRLQFLDVTPTPTIISVIQKFVTLRTLHITLKYARQCYLIRLFSTFRFSTLPFRMLANPALWRK